MSHFGVIFDATFCVTFGLILIHITKQRCRPCEVRYKTMARFGGPSVNVGFVARSVIRQVVVTAGLSVEVTDFSGYFFRLTARFMTRFDGAGEPVPVENFGAELSFVPKLKPPLTPPPNALLFTAGLPKLNGLLP